MNRKDLIEREQLIEKLRKKGASERMAKSAADAWLEGDVFAEERLSPATRQWLQQQRFGIQPALPGLMEGRA